MFEMSSGRQDHTTDTGPRPRRPLLAGAGVLLAAGLLAAPAQAAFPGKNGRVVYEKQPNREVLQASAAYDAYDGTELWTSDAKGGDLKLLVSFADREYPVASAHDPAVSPDGKRVAYVESGWADRSDPTYEQIRIIGIDGSNDHVLRDDIDAGSAPAWSPDGAKIVYVQEDAEGETTSLAVVPANGSQAPTTLNLNGLSYGPQNPQWSPDGRWIAFDAGDHVYVVPAAGGDPVLVGDRSGEDSLSDSYPNWAPYGSAIVFERSGDGSQLIEVPFDKGKPVNASEARVVGTDGGPERAVYSPDGLGVLYTAYAPQAPGRSFMGVAVSRGLVLAGADGSNPAPFVYAQWNEQLIAADWAPIPQSKPAPKPPAKPVVIVKPVGGVEGVTDRRCGSRRNFVIRLRPRGTKIVMARVIVNGKRVKAKKGKRWTARVDLRTLPKKRFKVDVTVWTKDGKRYHEVRRYWTCTPAR
jgi:Tol biopolymer transport system component